MSRREEEKVGRAPGAVPGTPAPNRRRIELRVGNPGITGPGMSAVLTDVWAEVGGKRVTEVEEGKVFDIKGEYTAEWPDKPLIIADWVVGITAIGDGVKIYDNTMVTSFRTSISGTMTLDNPSSPRMPDHDITLTIQPWGSGHSTDYYKAPWE